MTGESNSCPLCLTHPIINYCCTNKNCSNYQFNKYANQTDEPPKKRQRLNTSNELMHNMMSGTNSNLNDSGRMNSLNNYNNHNTNGLQFPSTIDTNLGRSSTDIMNRMNSMNSMNNLNNMNGIGTYGMSSGTGIHSSSMRMDGCSLNEMTGYYADAIDILQVDNNDASRFNCIVCGATGMRKTKAMGHAFMHLDHQNKGFGLVADRRGNYRCFQCSRIIHMSWIKSHIQQCTLTKNEVNRHSYQDHNRGVLTFGTAVEANVNVKTIRNLNHQ